MWIVLKEKFISDGSIVFGESSYGHMGQVIDRIVDSLDDVESGEIFIKCNIKK